MRFELSDEVLQLATKLAENEGHAPGPAQDARILEIIAELLPDTIQEALSLDDLKRRRREAGDP